MDITPKTKKRLGKMLANAVIGLGLLEVVILSFGEDCGGYVRPAIYCGEKFDAIYYPLVFVVTVLLTMGIIAILFFAWRMKKKL